jgi:hypothetical protein
MNTQKTYEHYHALLDKAIGQIINLNNIISGLTTSLMQSTFSYIYNIQHNSIMGYIEAKSLVDDHYYIVFHDLNKAVVRYDHLLINTLYNGISNTVSNILVQNLDGWIDNKCLKVLLGGLTNSTVKYLFTGHYDLLDLVFGALGSINAIDASNNTILFDENLLDHNSENYIMMIENKI